MAWNKESLGRANESIQEFGSGTPEHGTGEPKPQNETVLAYGYKDIDYGDQSWHDDYTLSEAGGSFLFKTQDGYTLEETKKEVDRNTAMRLIQERGMWLTDAGTGLFGSGLPEKDSAPLPSPAQEQHGMTAENADGARISVNNGLDLYNAEIERYGVTEKDCYTFHPEKDVLDEIFNRIRMAEMVIVSYEEFMEHVSNHDCIIYANIGDGDTVDLKLFDPKNGIDVSVPITEGEKEQVRLVTYEYEAVRPLPKQPAGKAHHIPEKE